MIVATYDLLTDEVRVLANVRTPARWKVDLWVRTPDGAKESTTLRPTRPCLLTDLMELAKQSGRELIDQHPAYVAGGFTVTRLR